MLDTAIQTFSRLIDDQVTYRQDQKHSDKNNGLGMNLVSILPEEFGA